jgi:hypothetical protein
MLKKMFITLCACIKKTETSQRKNEMLHLKPMDQMRRLRHKHTQQ